jgi:hypothetical protein
MSLSFVWLSFLGGKKQKKEAIFGKRCFDQMDVSFSITRVLKASVRTSNSRWVLQEEEEEKQVNDDETRTK